ncbi:ATP-binding cassette domain-containing protein [Bifidobacterium favimelis]|uniref:ATP-binding cassette domain-containing protein n=1 Tax=Bifidobacterium favimelis TaxID=3122979 RepID=A0ABU8ZNV3_9BIFI
MGTRRLEPPCRAGNGKRIPPGPVRQVRAIGLGHRFHQGPWLFHDLHFHLDPGEIVGVCGPSESGKSTLLSLIAGFDTPASGTVERPVISRIRWVFQNPHGMPRRTALDHVTQPLLGQGWNRQEAEGWARGSWRTSI